jgi:hypothetical protein
MSIRPRIQRAFVSWLANTPLKVPVTISLRTDQMMEIAFAVATPLLSASLDRRELNVAADWNGICWDFLLVLEAAPQKVTGGHVCTDCEPENRKLFPSREAVWIDHLFQPFGDWVNNELAVADSVGLYGGRNGGWTAAWLLPSNRSGDEPPTVTVPLWSEAMPKPP